MSKTKKVYYKVVNEDLKSCWAPIGIAIQYNVGNFVESPDKLPLAVFSNLNQAKKFRQMWDHTWRIFECNIMYKTKIPWLPGNTQFLSSRVQTIIDAIKKHKKFMKYTVNGAGLPPGSVTCKRVKLIKEIINE